MSTSGIICLITADEEKSRRLEAGLCQRGYEVRVAGSGREGLTRVREERPEVVLLDPELPDMEGLEVCRLIKADPGTGRTQVIMTDHFTSSRQRMKCLENGADACLMHPFENGELLAQVGACLRAARAEEEMRASKERLEFVLSSITDAYFAVDRNWSILDANPAAERLIFHASKERIMGKDLWSICPHGQDSPFYREYRKAFAEGRAVHFEAEGCEGELWFEIHAYPSGERLDVYGREITERKRQEAILKATQFTVDRAAEAIFWIDREAQFVYVNDAACESLGYTREELLNLGVFDIDPFYSREIWPGVWENLCQIRKLEFETEHRHKSGERFPVEIRANYVVYAGREYSCAFARDIRERKRAEEAKGRQFDRAKLLNQCAAYFLSAEEPARIVEGLYERVAESLQADALLEYELDYARGGLRLKTSIGIDEHFKERIMWLKSGEGLCGCVAQSRTPLVENNLEQSANPKAQMLREMGFKAYICQPLLAGNKLLGTLALASRRRTVLEEADREFFETISRYVMLGKERARLLDELRRHAGNLEELVTERTSKLNELVEDLENFSYAITHDMRAPLRAMAGFAQMLLRTSSTRLDPEAQEHLRRIYASARKMDALITDALRYTRALREHYPLRPTNVTTLVRELLDSLAHLRAADAEIEVVEPIPPVLANEAGLTQCISNLLSNAVKFVKPGQAPRVRIRGEMRGDYVRLWFEDNGIGIPPQYQGRVFAMFQRLNEHYEGTGIGLALVRKITERMGGRVGVESEPGEGSRFWLELRGTEIDYRI